MSAVGEPKPIAESSRAASCKARLQALCSEEGGVEKTAAFEYGEP
jgi:hypothetical protein